jgi:hypothetical protein
MLISVYFSTIQSETMFNNNPKESSSSGIELKVANLKGTVSRYGD